MTEIKLGRYKHWKGGEYIVTGIRTLKSFRSAWDNKTLVDYVDMEGNKYSRLEDEFFEDILISGKNCLGRFTYIGDDKKEPTNVSDTPKKAKPKGEML